MIIIRYHILIKTTITLQIKSRHVSDNAARVKLPSFTGGAFGERAGHLVKEIFILVYNCVLIVYLNFAGFYGITCAC